MPKSKNLCQRIDTPPYSLAESIRPSGLISITSGSFGLGITRRSSVYHHRHQRCLRVNEKNDGTYLVILLVSCEGASKTLLDIPFSASRRTRMSADDARRRPLLPSRSRRCYDVLMSFSRSCCDHVRWVRCYMSDTHTFVEAQKLITFFGPLCLTY